MSEPPRSFEVLIAPGADLPADAGGLKAGVIDGEATGVADGDHSLSRALTSRRRQRGTIGDLIGSCPGADHQPEVGGESVHDRGPEGGDRDCGAGGRNEALDGGRGELDVVRSAL